ncbi:MAG TPA: hypothetical protein VE110_10325 [Gemmatimonadaceae bacterium]|nr:hypothetical protein [Gemmatimonadaceae bacterium]
MQGKSDARLVWLGIILLIAGFFGHVSAARAIGGTHVAWRDHMIGFTGATILSALIVGAIGSFLWKGRKDITVLIVGALGFALGLVVFINPPH